MFGLPFSTGKTPLFDGKYRITAPLVWLRTGPVRQKPHHPPMSAFAAFFAFFDRFAPTRQKMPDILKK